MEGTEPMNVTMPQEDPIEHELPPRPRHRLLGVGGNPLALALLGMLLCACGFIGGVLVEKGQAGTGSGSGSGGLAPRLAGLRSAAGSATAGRGGGLSALLGGGTRSNSAGAGLGGAGGGGAPTVGQVAYVDGNILYVNDVEGDTVKVAASAGTQVSRTVKSHVASIHPGETVIVTGSAGSSGTIHAQSIRASEAGAGGGFAGLGGLAGGFVGGDGGLGGSARAPSGGGGSPSGEGARSEGGGGGREGPVLFGK